MSNENKNLIPTMKFRWRVTTLTKILEQFFLDRGVVKEDGTPADGKWFPVPIEVVDEGEAE